jgi:hypothetical protein
MWIEEIAKRMLDPASDRIRAISTDPAKPLTTRARRCRTTQPVRVNGKGFPEKSALEWIGQEVGRQDNVLL